MEHRPAWNPGSWREYPATQQPDYPDPQALAAALAELRTLPPLVHEGEIIALRQALTAASQGEAFILQGGDCAEQFADCNRQAVAARMGLLLEMSLILSLTINKPVIRIGRIAGQYGKPRSASYEPNGSSKTHAKPLPVFRGENINQTTPHWHARTADPRRLVRGYHHAALTINYMRALASGGFAAAVHKLTQKNPPCGWQGSYWPLTPAMATRLKTLEHQLATAAYPEALSLKVEVYTSHEGLILPLEEALTHWSQWQQAYYNLSAHLLWIGERTRQLQGAHVEYYRGIQNPIGLKLGPDTDPATLTAILGLLNPTRTPGRILLITRMGAAVTTKLPPLITAVQQAAAPVCWACDPMHANTIRRQGYKTREFQAILTELAATLACHRQLGSHLGGVHLEMCPEAVTECLGGTPPITTADLSRDYRSLCDPRLNHTQSLELITRLSTWLAPS